jgi:antitoxin ParD1/3/4
MVMKSIIFLGGKIMNVSLTKELEEMINQKVQSGLYNSASEVIREGLRLLNEQDQLRQIRIEELRREVQKGMDQMREGKYTSHTTENLHEFFDEIKKEARKELNEQKEQK